MLPRCSSWRKALPQSNLIKPWTKAAAFSTAQGKQRVVNRHYEPQSKPIPKLNATDNTANHNYEKRHNDAQWDDGAVNDAFHKHCLMAWGGTDMYHSLVAKVIRSSDGCYLYDTDGKKYIDFSSQAVCSNLGHTMPAEVRAAINEQIDSVSFLYGGLAVSEIRARLSRLLAEIAPGDINAFLFPSSGSEANEAAIRIARKYTGRKKILSRYRSYHGGTLGSLAMTGDSRRFDVDKDIPGFIKIFDPFPMYFKWTDSNNDDDEIAQKALDALHEQILLENPKDVAAIFIEGITGANGWLKPPVKYVQGLRALCDEYGIMLICDEVMAGFGRTGKMFSFEHFDGVLPDIMTFAKGLTSSFVPLSGVGVREHIMDFFRTTPLGYGSTFQAHPVSMACAYSVVKYLVDHDIVGHAANMEKVMEQQMQSLLDDYPECVAQARVFGMAGCIDVQNPETMDIICSTNETHAKTVELKRNLNKHGLISIVKGPVVHLTPPLIAQPEDIEYGFSVLRKALDDTFRA